MSIQDSLRENTLVSQILEQYSSLRYLKDRDILVVSVAGLLDFMSVYMIVPFLPVYLKQNEIGLAMLGIIFAAEPAASAIFSMPLGHLSDRYDQRYLIAGGTILSGLSVVALGFVSAPILFVVFRALDGTAGAIRGPATRTYVGERFETEERGRAFGAVKTVRMMGIAIGPALGGLVAGATNLSIPFILLGIVTVVGGIGAGTLLTKTTPDEDDEESSDDPPLWRLSRTELREIVTRPVVAMSITSVVSAASISAFEPLFALLLEEAHGATPLNIGTIWAIFGVCMMVFMPIGGTLADRTGGRRRGMVLSRAVWATVFLLLAAFIVPYLPILLIAVGGVASAIGGPAMGALTYETAPEGYEGSVMGFYGSLGSAGAVVGPIAGGLLADTVGLRLTLGVVAVVVALDAVNILAGVSPTLDGTEDDETDEELVDETADSEEGGGSSETPAASGASADGGD